MKVFCLGSNLAQKQVIGNASLVVQLQVQPQVQVLVHYLAVSEPCQGHSWVVLVVD